MSITRNELIRQFATNDNPLKKYWTALLSHVALNSTEDVDFTNTSLTTITATAQRFSTGSTTTAQTTSGSNFTFHKMYGKVAVWSPSTTITGMEIVAWSTANVTTGLELRGAEIKASVDKTGANTGIATSIYAKVTNKGATPVLATARGIHVYIENDGAGGTITDSSIFYVEYGLGTHTTQFLFDFAAVSNAVQADTSTPPAVCSHKIQCRVGGVTFWVPGYTSI
jgi:hypothetical protein